MKFERKQDVYNLFARSLLCVSVQFYGTLLVCFHDPTGDNWNSKCLKKSHSTSLLNKPHNRDIIHVCSTNQMGWAGCTLNLNFLFVGLYYICIRIIETLQISSVYIWIWKSDQTCTLIMIHSSLVTMFRYFFMESQKHVFSSVGFHKAGHVLSNFCVVISSFNCNVSVALMIYWKRSLLARWNSKRESSRRSGTSFRAVRTWGRCSCLNPCASLYLDDFASV